MKDFAVKMMHEPGDQVAEVHLYSAIGGSHEGGISASDFVTAIKSLPENVHIEAHYNSAGGNPFEAIAMATALAAHPGGYTAIVDGICASSATIPFSVAKQRQMRKGAMLMIHEPSQRFEGVSMRADDLKKFAGRLEAVTESAVGFYEAATGKSRQSLLKMMADETWLNDETARYEGFVTETIPAAAVAASLDLTSFNNVPEAAMSLVEPLSKTPETKEPTMADPKPELKEEKKSTPEMITMSVEQYEQLKVAQKPAPVIEPSKSIESLEMSADEVKLAERKRVANIHAICMKCGIDAETEMKFVNDGSSIEMVQGAALDKVTASLKPPQEGGGSGADDENTAYRKEFKDAVSSGMKMEVSEDEYVQSRRISDGKEKLSVLA